MGISILNPAKYGRLCAEVIPKVIETDEEFHRLVAQMEALDRRKKRTPEEEAMAELLAKLIQDYDDQIEFPAVPPHEMIQYLMKQRGLRQADLLPIFGSRSIASNVVGGKREPSKAHIRALAEFFHVSPALFL